MASFNEIKTRNVIPNWRSYKKTGELGEFRDVRAKLPGEGFVFPIDDYVEDWRHNKSLAFAGDLLSAAIMNGQSNNPDAIEAAKFIIDHKDEASKLLLRTAESLFPQKQSVLVKTETINEKLNSVFEQEESLKQRIRTLKKAKDFCCYNPIAYCELARCYTILGQQDKAEEMMNIALHLAPAHRYISRSAARLFLHLGDHDKAHYIVSHNPWIPKDPWLMATEIGINTLDNRSSRFIKKGMELISSQNYSPFSTSELASAIGSIEMMNGKRKSCRSYMNIALIDPNDNSFAQAQWLVSENKDLKLNFANTGQILAKSEADSIIAYETNRFDDALSVGIDWIEDMPFTRRPIQFASNMAYTYVKNYDAAIRILEFGLKSNPQDATLLNNLAYAYSLNNQPQKAIETLDQIPKETKSSDYLQVCIIATRGMAEYRSGNSGEGERLYLEAMKAANDLAIPEYKKELLSKALLNYIREKALAKQAIDEELVNKINKIPTGDGKDMIQLKADALAALKYNQQVFGK